MNPDVRTGLHRTVAAAIFVILAAFKAGLIHGQAAEWLVVVAGGVAVFINPRRDSE